MEKYDVLKSLSCERIFSVERNGDNFVFNEECDNHFYFTLNKVEMLRLIEQLQELVNTYQGPERRKHVRGQISTQIPVVE